MVGRLSGGDEILFKGHEGAVPCPGELSHFADAIRWTSAPRSARCNLAFDVFALRASRGASKCSAMVMSQLRFNELRQ